MIQCFPGPYERSTGNVKVEFGSNRGRFKWSNRH